jgi:hypothetical protein
MTGGLAERYDFFLSRRGSVAAVAREVANVLKQGFASDETVSSVYETRLKQSACSMAADRCLRSVPLRHPPTPALGVNLLRTIRR